MRPTYAIEQARCSVPPEAERDIKTPIVHPCDACPSADGEHRSNFDERDSMRLAFDYDLHVALVVLSSASPSAGSGSGSTGATRLAPQAC